jgi:hypothetical protein
MTIKKAMNNIREMVFTCPNCGREYNVITFNDSPFCGKGVCCSCCKRQGLQSKNCEMEQLTLERFAQGKDRLNKNHLKGLLMEKAVSDALYELGILHDHIPFDNIYPCYQNKRPDIIVDRLNMTIECKNLSQKQIEGSLSEEWLDKNITKRPYFKNYKRKIAFFSYRPKQSSVEYLNKHGWRVYSLGTQILTVKQMKKSIGKIKQRFYWLKKQVPSQA